MRKVWMEWPDFDIKIPFELEDNQNRGLCDEVWDALPFQTIQEHGVVSGKLIYTWAPLVSLADAPLQQLHSEAPVGRVAYSQGTGNKIIIIYGEISEDLPAPVLGLIPDEYHEQLKVVGEKIWHNTVGPKTIYTVRFTRG